MSFDYDHVIDHTATGAKGKGKANVKNMVRSYSPAYLLRFYHPPLLFISTSSPSISDFAIFSCLYGMPQSSLFL